MASVLIASDLLNDPFVNTELPELLGRAGHRPEIVHPLENLVSAARVASLAGGGVDLGILLHSTAAATGRDSAFRVAQKLRVLSDAYTFRNSVKAKALPLIVVAKADLLREVESDQLSKLGSIAIHHAESPSADLLTCVKEVIFRWRTDLLRDLECAGFAIEIGSGGNLRVQPAFVKAEVEGEIISSKSTLESLTGAGYLVVSDSVFKAASSYRRLAYLLENFRTIAKARKTKPEELFQEFFAENPEFLFAREFARVWPRPRFILPEDKDRWLEPDFVVQPNVAAQLGSRWKILDIKLPDVSLVRSRGFHPTFSSKLAAALQQLADYHKYFGRMDAREYILKQLGFQPRNPKLAVLIGRKASVDVATILDHAQESLLAPNVEIITYDDVLESRSLAIANDWEWLRRLT